MISVITYGRNDNYGFNLYKRTAFGFNCLAEVLTEEDEILFVDYNTPGHLPTLPEFIWDTLTEKALNMIRVIRVAPEIHERIKQDSPLKVLENVSRNIAIVRGNPQNRWILSTNPDVVLVLASRWHSLDALLENRPNSFYEMPRFDIPESVWSSLSRFEPGRNAKMLRDWLVHHKAAIPETIPDYRFQKFYLFDAPGDFQLAPREYFLRLHGFDESMNKYLHSDSNLAKRMWLLNGGRTDHLLGDLWVLHQDHYLSGEWARNVSTIAHNNCLEKVFHQSEIEANDEAWGLRDVDLPTFLLADKIKYRASRFFHLPSTANGDLPLSCEPDWRLQPFYRICHYQPEVLVLYLREIFQVLSPEARVFYLGQNAATLEELRKAWAEITFSDRTVQDLSETVARGESVTPDVLLVDLYYERPEFWDRRIRLLEQRLQRQLQQGRISQLEAEEEVARFTDNADAAELEKQVLPLWEKTLRFINLRRGVYVILMGCNPYISLLSHFHQIVGTQKLNLDLAPTALQRAHALYQRLKVRMQSKAEPSLILRILWGIRLLKRRVLRRVIGHESVMGLIYYHHVLRRRKYLTKSLKLTTLYVHHRLVMMRVEI